MPTERRCLSRSFVRSSRRECSHSWTEPRLPAGYIARGAMPVTTSADLDLARAAFDPRARTEVADRLREADAERELEIEDLERLSVAVHMLGRSDESQRILERAHLAALRAGDPIRAARHAFYLVMSF